MRTLLFGIAGVFVLGGIIALVRPQPALVGHPGTPYSPATTENLPTDHARAYGIVALSIGAVVLLTAITWKRTDELD